MWKHIIIKQNKQKVELFLDGSPVGYLDFWVNDKREDEKEICRCKKPNPCGTGKLCWSCGGYVKERKENK